MIARTFIDMPDRIAKLPVSEKGFPVPYFATWFDGVPDFRVADAEKLAICHKQERCWICGDRLGAYRAYCIGPMCGVNRVTSEPGQHRECSIFAARNCPFLAQPMARRRERDMPEGHHAPPGEFLKRNPGVTAVWIQKTRAKPFKVDAGYLFKLDDPVEVLWFAEGLPATRAQIDASVASGLPLLVNEAARQQALEGVPAIKELEQQHRAFERLLDAQPMP